MVIEGGTVVAGRGGEKGGDDKGRKGGVMNVLVILIDGLCVSVLKAVKSCYLVLTLAAFRSSDTSLTI